MWQRAGIWVDQAQVQQTGVDGTLGAAFLSFEVATAGEAALEGMQGARMWGYPTRCTWSGFKATSSVCLNCNSNLCGPISGAADGLTAVDAGVQANIPVVVPTVDVEVQANAVVPTAEVEVQANVVVPAAEIQEIPTRPFLEQ